MPPAKRSGWSGSATPKSPVFEFPKHTAGGKYIAQKASEYILKKHPGKWKIKFNENNLGSKNLWEKVTQKYNPAVHNISGEETVLEFSDC